MFDLVVDPADSSNARRRAVPTAISLSPSQLRRGTVGASNDEFRDRFIGISNGRSRNRIGAA
ncbi:hypothetical protein [Actinoalloteichus hymeniacidonis]|uniref:hypothetical protein n=1 Tax=Actinoalloteichus hymeniacidonis TaxID=340345 RepID=UPI0012FA6D6B|nr:hypothetical protein [Actinoalloteichus hymeniacidonis]MBB5907808.1 hypothetical protein [Actinoalloteichus hymeniacidonis]